MIKHNCCKYCLFEWEENSLRSLSEDVIKCKICGRMFKELKEKEKDEKS